MCLEHQSIGRLSSEAIGWRWCPCRFRRCIRLVQSRLPPPKRERSPFRGSPTGVSDLSGYRAPNESTSCCAPPKKSSAAANTRGMREPLLQCAYFTCPAIGVRRVDATGSPFLDSEYPGRHKDPVRMDLYRGFTAPGVHSFMDATGYHRHVRQKCMILARS